MYRDKIVKKIVAFLQKGINREYESEGLSDNLFRFQLKLNEFKAKHNISVDDEIITDDGFLQ